MSDIDWITVLKYIISNNHKHLFSKYSTEYQNYLAINVSNNEISNIVISLEEARSFSKPPYTSMWNIIFNTTDESSCIVMIHNMLEIMNCSGCIKHYNEFYNTRSQYTDFTDWLTAYHASTLLLKK